MRTLSGGFGCVVGESELGLLAFTWREPCAVILAAWSASVATTSATATSASFAALALFSTYLTGGGVGALFASHDRVGQHFGGWPVAHCILAFAGFGAFCTSASAVATLLAFRAWTPLGALLRAVAVGRCRVQVACWWVAHFAGGSATISREAFTLAVARGTFAVALAVASTTTTAAMAAFCTTISPTIPARATAFRACVGAHFRAAIAAAGVVVAPFWRCAGGCAGRCRGCG